MDNKTLYFSAFLKSMLINNGTTVGKDRMLSQIKCNLNKCKFTAKYQNTKNFDKSQKTRNFPSH